MNRHIVQLYLLRENLILGTQRHFHHPCFECLQMKVCREEKQVIGFQHLKFGLQQLTRPLGAVIGIALKSNSAVFME